MYRWFIAFKYLTSRFITFAALLIVAGGVALLIVILSVMEGFRSELGDRIRGTSADIRVESKNFIGLRDPEALERTIQAVPGVLWLTPYVETLTMAHLERDSEPHHFFLQAMDLARYGERGELSEYLKTARERGAEAWSGGGVGLVRALLADQPVEVEVLLSPEWLQKGLWVMSGRAVPEKVPPPLFVGYEAMKDLKLVPGWTIHLTSYSPVTNRTVSGEFVVAGVFKSWDYQHDRQTLLMPLAAAIDFLQLRDPTTGKASVSGVRVSLAPDEELARASKRIAAAVAGVPFVRVRTWREEKARLLRAVSIEKTVMGIILGVVIIFAGLIVFIVLTVQVVEKTRDLGILQSLGSTSFGIARIYFLVGAWVCLLGTLLGAFLGVAFSLSINTILRWTYLLIGFELFPRNMYYIDSIPVRLELVDLLFIIAPTMLASLLASVIPAYRAARKDPVVALRYE